MTRSACDAKKPLNEKGAKLTAYKSHREDTASILWFDDQDHHHLLPLLQPTAFIKVNRGRLFFVAALRRNVCVCGFAYEINIYISWSGIKECKRNDKTFFSCNCKKVNSFFSLLPLLGFLLLSQMQSVLLLLQLSVFVSALRVGLYTKKKTIKWMKNHTNMHADIYWALINKFKYRAVSNYKQIYICYFFFCCSFNFILNFKT